MRGQDPIRWSAPNWHKDYGDPVPELELLRSCAQEVLGAIEGSEVELRHVEDGYMYVAIRIPGKRESNVYAVERGKGDPGKWFGVFQDVNTNIESENYVRRPEEVVSLLNGP